MLLHLDGRKLVLLCIGDRLIALLLPEPPTPIRKFCDCALAVSGKSCMRRPRLRRGRARRSRRRHGGRRCERGPPGDDDGGDPPGRRKSTARGASS